MLMNIETSGDRRAYALDPSLLGEGGYANVYRARVKATGDVVAFKRVKSKSREDLHRLRREVTILKSLQPNPHVMPVLDSDPNHTWYVMPLAEGDAEALRPSRLRDERAVEEMMQHAIRGLEPAHKLGLVHRDITPRNILLLDTGEESRWVVADWGLVRRPLGQTTERFTQSGVRLGTQGFAAPELRRGSHSEASSKSDVYSLGRLLAWAVTGTWPAEGGPLLPQGRFRRLVRLATQAAPTARPTLDEFSDLLVEAFHIPVDHLAQAADLVARAQEGDSSSGAQVWQMGLDRLHDGDLIVDHVARLPPRMLKKLMKRSFDNASQILEAMKEFMLEEGEWRWGKRAYDSLDVRLSWFRYAADAAIESQEWGFLEDAAEAMFEAEAKWQQYHPRHATRKWLETLRGTSAEAVARALRASPDAVDWYMEEGWEPAGATASPIRGALRARD